MANSMDSVDAGLKPFRASAALESARSHVCSTLLQPSGREERLIARYVLGQLGILRETLVCGLGKKSANGNQFYCLISVSPAYVVHAPTKVVFVKLGRSTLGIQDRRTGHF